jgi:nicotinamidase/pyrazinamidase
MPPEQSASASISAQRGGESNVGRIVIDSQSDILGLIDIQPTFMPGGELPVADGAAVVASANRLLKHHFAHAFATQDWHPPGHTSFATTHPDHAAYDIIERPYGPQTLWPDHAIQGSAGAELHPDLWAPRIELVVRKGFRPEIDSYSAFYENDRRTPTGLAGYLRERGFTRVFLAGLATDFCVAFSAEDAVRAGFSAVVVEDACRGIGLPLAGGGNTLAAAQSRLAGMGVAFVTMAELS